MVVSCFGFTSAEIADFLGRFHAVEREKGLLSGAFVVDGVLSIGGLIVDGGLVVDELLNIGGLKAGGRVLSSEIRLAAFLRASSDGGGSALPLPVENPTSTVDG